MCIPPRATGQGSLRLTGILYPRAKTTPENLGERCEEFTVDELDKLVSDLQGLDVCVEHNMENLVGRVVNAHKTHCNAVQVEAIVNASTPNGRQAVQDIIDKKLVAFSLSHSYDLRAVNGLEAAKLQVALRENNDRWKQLTDNIREGHSVHKELRELSLCAEPARAGCQIHSVVDASASCQQTPHNINKSCAGKVEEQPHAQVVGVFSCSMEGTPTENAQPTIAPESTLDAAAPVAAEPAADPVAAAVNEAQKQPRDAVGRYSTKADKPADEQATAQPPAEEPGAAPAETNAQEMDSITDSLRQAGEQIRSQADLLAASKAEKEEMSKRLADMEAQVAAATKAANDAKEQAEKQRVDAENKARQQAESRRNSALRDLQKLLKADHIGKATEGAASDITRASNEAELVEAAIKAVQEGKQTEQMAAQNLDTARAEKEMIQREKENVVRSLTNFGVHQAPAHSAMINASSGKRAAADMEAPANKRQALPLVSMCEFGASHPTALWHDYVSHYRSLSAPAAGTAGLVNASNAIYKPSSMCAMAPCSVDELSARECQPYLFDAMKSYMNGQTPGASETATIVDGLRSNQPNRRIPGY